MCDAPSGPIQVYSIHSIKVEAESEVRQNPPKFTLPNKILALRYASPLLPVQRGNVGVSQWVYGGDDQKHIFTAPVMMDKLGVDVIADMYRYGSDEQWSRVAKLCNIGDDALRWYVNFADRELFGFYGGPCFAQDEWQVLEHPTLASLREMLLHRYTTRAGWRPMCATENKKTGHFEPSPWLIRGVPRQLRVDCGKLYGNRMVSATKEQVLDGISNVGLEDAYTNILCMAAPISPGPGSLYTRGDLLYILKTAVTAFSAACTYHPSRTLIATGHWGCGAFGGNRFVMAVLQIMAAALAKVNQLVYFSMDAQGSIPVLDARAFVRHRAGYRACDILSDLLDTKPRWASSNGT